MNHEGIYALYPNVVTIRDQEDGSVICYDKDDNIVKINATTVVAWVDPNAYKYARAYAYPSIGDQLDMQYHDMVDGTTKWKDTIAKIKSDNPKPK